MPLTRRHVFFDGLKVTLLTLGSFSVFMLVLAQTFQLPAQCVEKGITDAVACKEYIASLNAGPVCGNAMCEAAKGESHDSCPDDCKLQLPAQCVEKGITNAEECSKYMASLKSAICGNAMCEGTKGETAETCPADCRIQLPAACHEKGITTTVECEAYMKSLNAGPVCGNGVCEGLKGESAASCSADCHVQLPAACVEKGITTPVDCEAYMRSLTAANGGTNPPPAAVGAACGNGACETFAGETPEKCPIDCPAQRAGTTSLPEECIRAGITDPTACKQHMEASGAAATAVPSVQLPPQCVEKGIKDPTECKRYMESVGGTTFQQPRAFCGNKICEIAAGESSEACPSDCPATGAVKPPSAAFQLPPQCVEKGIKDPTECRAYMEKTAATERDGQQPAAQLPELCRQKGITEAEECKKVMQAAFGGTMERSVGAFAASVVLPKACQEAGITEPKKCAELVSAGRAEADGFKPEFLPKECQDRKITNARDCEKFFAERALPKDCKDAGATNADECKRLLTKKRLPEECLKQGIEDEAACRAALEKAFLPKACADQGITSMDECKSFLLEKHGRPTDCAGTDDATCLRLIETGQVKDKKALDALATELPARCREIGATDYASCQAAQEKKLLPQECRDAGIFSPEACKKYFFEKYQEQAADNKPVPQECVDAGKTDRETCGAYLKSRYLPKECVEQKIGDPEACKKYLTSLHLPQECKDAGVEDRDACEKLLRSTHMAPACASQGITDEAACKEFIYGRIASKIGCEGLTADECATTVKERHLGAILDKTNKIEEVGNVLGETTDEDGGIDLAALAVRGDDLRKKMLDVMPFRPGQERKLRALRSNADVEITEDDAVVATAPALLAFDTDGDGIPDDAEKRLGTDPGKADTDGDGTDDAAELKEKKLRGIDKAIADGRALGQPKNEGETDEDLTVVLNDEKGKSADKREDADKADNKNDKSENGEGTTLGGTGTPGDVVTVYIYSDLPLVVTTTVDENGQWSYTLDDPLKDGSHEVYVAVNDDTGKVVRKSSPLALLVVGAQAAETAAAVSAPAPTPAQVAAASPDANAQQGRSSESDLKVFAFAGIGLAVVGLIVAAALLLGRKKKGDAPPQP